MAKRDKIAFTLYLMFFLTMLAFGAVYLFCSTFMPYHQQALNMSWEELGTRLQVLIQDLIKIAAAGCLVTGFSGLILLLVPFRQGKGWAHWAIPLIGVVWSLLSLYAAVLVAIKTGAATPWVFSLFGMTTLIGAFIISPGYKKTYKLDPQIYPFTIH